MTTQNSNSGKRVIYRSSKTGEIITKKEAEKRPNESERETVRVPKKRK